MKFVETGIAEVVIIEPSVFEDDRGYFLESFNKDEFEKNIGKVDFVQDNESKSIRGVLRGLHFQKPPFAQAKLVRCIKGAVIDVVVDIRTGSETYGKHITVELSEDNKKQLFIPRGFAHGFMVLSEEAIFSYKVDNSYAPAYDCGIKWDDKDLGIDWRFNEADIKLSEKDTKLQYFNEFTSPFKS
ncbi:dTDP-4-dehydrorhamnose 3,5-epimerase [Tenacibaculum sp. Bg11-29]|uniref:dTDP-4-dehydrorhamnose 3,5-epimerase n=1 Tax=Tenacibaculum sp. Bg11-29 TaxID=2058306 RepID=UPI000C34E5F2|nr:dTDP-4-dehydrorhamnose 3,5-epimerase [Tenacibaculum sp. Bg11-29]PKH50434.1 dTDP-4-dehydrorhamnose 3,5-epimerase [Tenacibaculum sp. Bg11-29]